MCKLRVFTVFILLSFIMSGTSFSAEEIYLTDARKNPGKIFQILADRHGYMEERYSSKSGKISAVAFDGYGLAYFTDADKYNIYRTNGITENLIFTHSTYVRDLAFDSRGKLCFSEATGAGGNGVIYRLDTSNGRVTRFVTVFLDEVDGSWAGNFAFDPSHRLFISSGNRVPASIYEYINGHFQKRFTHNESITGFCFVNDNTLYFTNHLQKLYELRDFQHLSVKHEAISAEWLNDVALVRVPDGGECQLSGRLIGGKAHWPATYIEVYGPNVLWRTSAGDPVKVNRNGAYSFRNLPSGSYMIKTDIHAETIVGFTPESRIVICPRDLKNINFTYPSRSLPKSFKKY